MQTGDRVRVVYPPSSYTVPDVPHNSEWELSSEYVSMGGQHYGWRLKGREDMGYWPDSYLVPISPKSKSKSGFAKFIKRIEENGER